MSAVTGLYFLILFPQIRKTCIEALSELIKSETAFDNILLARKYKVKRWLRDGYLRLLQQKGELELGDDICSSKLDLITIARLLYIREKKHCQVQSNGRCLECGGVASGDYFNSDEANQKIDEVFADEIAGMKDE